MKIEDSGRKINKQDVINLEQRINGKLPDGYINFLKRYNGGSPEKFRGFDIKDSRYFLNGSVVESAVSFFFAIDYELKILDIYENIRIFKDGNRVPDEFLPIADDPCGNLILLCYKGKDYGKIYFWDHEEEADTGEPVTYDNIYYVADSFTEFLDSLFYLEMNKDFVFVSKTYQDGTVESLIEE